MPIKTGWDKYMHTLNDDDDDMLLRTGKKKFFENLAIRHFPDDSLLEPEQHSSTSTYSIHFTICKLK